VDVDDRRLLTRRPWYLRRGLHVLAAVVVAVLTAWFAGGRATGGVRAGLDDRLLQAGAGADAAVVAVESEQLSAVRAVAFTTGMAAAVRTKNGPTLNRLVTPLQANSTVPMVDVVDTGGRVLLAVRSKGAPAPIASRAGLRALELSLRRANGSRGGRLTELAVLRSGPTLVTVSPIVAGRKPVGAVLAMTPLADVLGRVGQEVGTELTAYDANGAPLATTATFNPTPVVASTARSLVGGAAVVTRYVYMDHREKLGRLIVDHTPDAVLGVSREDDSNVTGRWVTIDALVGILAVVAILSTMWLRFAR
jgi:cobalamin biosynthesis Mg chelatase CobN